ncbi:MAG: hypothetical protein M3Z31_00125 [Pseudomonadota bacterium]|nr:hypothetical protein [Pseudomonadota bacterium]
MSALNVFNFLSSRDTTDPLQNPRTAAAWLHELPALDVMERQQQVMRAFETMRHNRKPVDLARANAVVFLDAALGADRRQLIKQYVENVETAPSTTNRLWQALQELTQAFVFGYKAALEQAIAQSATAKWKAVVPMLFARLIHYHGTDSKLRVFRFERWIPAKWKELHELYARAVELGVDRAPTALGSSAANVTQWTVEQEYINVLLMHQLNTGNLTPAELDWGSAQLRAWTRRLTLDASSRSPDGFVVDIAGKAGLVRRGGGEPRGTARYLDTTPLAAQLDRAIVAIRRAGDLDTSAQASMNRQRISILERIRPSVAPSLLSDMRRDPRVPVQVSAQVRVGLGRICRDIVQQGPAPAPQQSDTEHIEVFAVNDGSQPRRRAVDDTGDSMMASLGGFSEATWKVKDRSVAGLRIAASGGIGKSLALGALVAVQQADLSEWVLGVVRRLNRLSNDDSEAGLSIIAERIVPVTLNVRRDDDGALAMDVNGLDVSTMGARFDGLYLPPPSRPDKPLSVKSLIIPTSEYVDGRSILLTTGRSIYTVALRHMVEQRADWTWCAIQIVEKKPRAY